jgi:hypothetical protein
MERIARLETLARAGYAARGLVYLLLGYLALSSGSGQGTTDVFQRLRDAPAGTLVLILTAFGLLGYGVFRLYGGWLDLDGKGEDAGGRFQRAGQVASGLGHFVLSVAALRLALGGGSGRGGSSGGAASSLPGGDLLLIVVGLLVIVAGLGNLLEAWKASFRNKLDARAPDWTHWAGRAGYAARGLIFLLVGWQLVTLPAVAADAGTESALAALSDREWLFAAVALGLLLFGLFSLIMARFARIRDENVVARLKAAVAGH